MHLTPCPRTRKSYQDLGPSPWKRCPSPSPLLAATDFFIISFRCVFFFPSLSSLVALKPCWKLLGCFQGCRRKPSLRAAATISAHVLPEAAVASQRIWIAEISAAESYTFHLEKLLSEAFFFLLVLWICISRIQKLRDDCDQSEKRVCTFIYDASHESLLSFVSSHLPDMRDELDVLLIVPSIERRLQILESELPLGVCRFTVVYK